MDYNYHTHTFRCHHASGTPEEYVLRAIEGGIKYMGFSDHVPVVFSDGSESWFRVPFAQTNDYVSEISKLAEKYKDRIDIKIGFEMEYYPQYFEKTLENAKKAGAQYLILAQHFIRNEFPEGIYVKNEYENAEYLKEYADTVVEGIKSGVFTYVAHPDLFNYKNDDKFYGEQMRKICIASRQCGIPLEINFLGIRRKKHYPNNILWEIAGQEKSPVTFGFDAHTPLDAYDDVSEKVAQDMVKKYKLNYIGKPEIILI